VDNTRGKKNEFYKQSKLRLFTNIIILCVNYNEI
jgi:hypothetical protein